MSEQIKGRFLWFDLMTTDPAAAEKFYGAVIGWGTQPWEGPQPYTMWALGDTPLGGLMELPEEARQAGAPSHWLAYVGSDDIDATVAQIEAGGGCVLVPVTDIPGTGKFAVVQDPQGAVSAVYTSETDPPPQKEPGPGEFSWHELATTDYEAAFKFYAGLYGWKKTEAMDMGDAGIYQMYGQGERTYGGMFNKPAEMPGPPAWLHYITVDSVEEAADRVTANGGTILNGPMEVPGGDKIVQCMDPQGAAFAMYSKK